MVRYVLPVFIILIFLYAFFKRVRVYDTFTEGAKQGFLTIIEIIPFLISICVLIEIFSISGLQTLLCELTAPIFNLFGVPKELLNLLLLRPFSGSATTAVFQEIMTTYGADSYLTRVAGTIMGSSETVFYVTAIYFSKLKLKNLGATIPISLICSLISAILACAICKVI